MVRQEIKKAEYLYQKHGRAVLKDPDLLPLINRYKASIGKSFLAMSEVGVIAACSSCAGVTTSGCCFSGVEEWYDGYLLFLNLLLGRKLPVKAEVSGSCLFVGEKGCKLTARHSFCVNFLCPDLLTGFTRDQKKNLLGALGCELQAGWELEKSLRNKFKL